jgi:lipase chaperone LimK
LSGKRSGCIQFSSKRVPYFSEEDVMVDIKIKDRNSTEYESSINGHTLEEKKEECVAKEQRLLEDYDETVLLQDQDDIRKRTHLYNILI